MFESTSLSRMSFVLKEIQLKWSKIKYPSWKNSQLKPFLFFLILAELVFCLPDKIDSQIEVHQEDSRPLAEKKRKVEQSLSTISSSLYSSRNREYLVAEIRTRLSEYLVSFYCHMRHHLVQRFLSTSSVVLDVLLTSSFPSLIKSLWWDFHKVSS